MKTRLMFFIAAVALVTLSFTFATVDNPKNATKQIESSKAPAQIGGLVSDEVIK